MGRGKAFICWLDLQGGCHHHDVKLRQGDAVMFRVSRRWWRGTIHCIRDKYVVRIGRRTFCALWLSHLKPIVED